MRHDYSLAHLTVAVALAAAARRRRGAHRLPYVGLRMTRVTPDEVLYDLARDKALMKETKARLAATGVAVHDSELFRMDPALEPEHFLPELDATAELGAHHLIAQLPDPDRERATARFARLCDLAISATYSSAWNSRTGPRRAILPEAARVVRAVNRSNAGILVDMLHFGRSDSTLDELAAAAARVVPLRARLRRREGSAADDGGIIRTARDERQFPGEGGIDVRGILARMPQDIPYALEIPRVALTKAVGPEEVARLAVTVARSHLDDSARDRRAAVYRAHRHRRPRRRH